MEPSFFSSSEGYRVQKTISHSITFHGIGLHSGMTAELTLHPAPANHGIIFERLDILPVVKIPAYFKSVISTSMATSIGIKDRPSLKISTIEHLMAALYALGITNILAQLTGPEIPILDDLDKLQANNLAQGASLKNVLAFSETGILNPEGARFTDECVRHKLLDAIGDLALCGCWIEGELVSFRGGHSIHLTLLQSLEIHPTHWKLLPAEPLKMNFKQKHLKATKHLSF